MVKNKAAALVDKEGKTAFAEFRKPDSEWRFDDTYLFAYDTKLNVLLNAAFTNGKRWGDVHGKRDANGKAMHDEFLKVVQTKGSGWVDYMFPKPGQTHPSQKWSYVKETLNNLDEPDAWERRHASFRGQRAAGKAGRRQSAARSGFSRAVFGVKTDSGRHQAGPGASRVFLTITRLASANRVCSCAVFLARPR